MLQSLLNAFFLNKTVYNFCVHNTEETPAPFCRVVITPQVLQIDAHNSWSMHVALYPTNPSRYNIHLWHQYDIKLSYIYQPCHFRCLRLTLNKLNINSYSYMLCQHIDSNCTFKSNQSLRSNKTRYVTVHMEMSQCPRLTLRFLSEFSQSQALNQKSIPYWNIHITNMHMSEPCSSIPFFINN